MYVPWTKFQDEARKRGTAQVLFVMYGGSLCLEVVGAAAAVSGSRSMRQIGGAQG